MTGAGAKDSFRNGHGNDDGGAPIDALVFEQILGPRVAADGHDTRSGGFHGRASALKTTQIGQISASFRQHPASEVACFGIRYAASAPPSPKPQRD